MRPVVLALLQVREFQIGQFASPESATKQYSEYRAVPVSFQRVRRGRLPEATSFLGREPVSESHAQLFDTLHASDSSRSSGLSKPASAAS